MVQQGMTFQHKQPLKKRLWKARWFYLLMLPGILYFIIYKYVPMFGLVMAFQDYSPSLGFFASPWVGLKHFDQFFSYGQFEHLFSNTLIISLLCLVFSFPAPVILALFLNEIRHKGFKRVTQTLMYLPHFLSWVILGGILTDVLSPSTGIVNRILGLFGMEPVFFLGDAAIFPYTMIWTEIWKEMGFGAVIYLATLTGIDPTYYEAAVVDGATRWKQTVYITLPCLTPTIVLLSMLALGNVLNAGFDQVYNMYSISVYSTGDIIDTFIYRLGLEDFQFSPSAAVGLFKSAISTVLIILSYKLADITTGYRII